MSDRISNEVRPGGAATEDFGAWFPAKFDASDELPNGSLSERFADDPARGGYSDHFARGTYSSPPAELLGLLVPTSFALPYKPLVINGRQSAPPRPRGEYFGRSDMPQSLPISEYSDSARGWVNRSIKYESERLERGDAGYVAAVRAACNFQIFFVWDTEKKRLSIEAPRNKLIAAWATEGAVESNREFSSAIRNLQCAPTRAYMWDTLRIALLQAQFDTEVAEKTTSRDALFRLRLATPDTKLKAGSCVLDFECFFYVCAAGMSVEQVLDALVRVGVLSQDGQVLRVISPAELHERILMPIHESTPESEVTPELAHALCLTLLCLFELRTHECVEAVLLRHCLEWVQIEECFEDHRVAKEILKDSIPENSEQSKKIDQFIELWYALRGRERQLRHVAGATDQSQVRRIFPETNETRELLNIFGEGYRYPASSQS